MKVLIIEDTREVATLIEFALRKLNLDIVHVTNGQQGLDYVAFNRPDLLILDIGLPGMSGWQFLDEASEYENIRDIPVIVLTAHADTNTRETGTFYRIDAFLAKPVKPNVIRDTVEKLLS